MDRRLSLVTSMVVGFAFGYLFDGILAGGAIALGAGLLAFGLGAAQRAPETRPTRRVFVLPQLAAVAAVTGVAALFDLKVTAFVVGVVGVAATPFVAHRAHSWAQASALGVGMFVVWALLAWIVFLVYFSAHGGLE